MQHLSSSQQAALRTSINIQNHCQWCLLTRLSNLAIQSSIASPGFTSNGGRGLRPPDCAPAAGSWYALPPPSTSMADAPPAAACVAPPPGLPPVAGPDPDWGCACAGRGSCHVGAVRQASSGGSRSPCALPISGSGCALRLSASAVRICRSTSRQHASHSNVAGHIRILYSTAALEFSLSSC